VDPVQQRDGPHLAGPGVTGPCTTWVGGPEAATEAELAASLDLDDGVVDHALVVTLAGAEPPDAAGSPVRVELRVVVLSRDDAIGSVDAPTAADLRR